MLGAFLFPLDLVPLLGRHRGRGLRGGRNRGRLGRRFLGRGRRRGLFRRRLHIGRGRQDRLIGDRGLLAGLLLGWRFHRGLGVGDDLRRVEYILALQHLTHGTFVQLACLFHLLQIFHPFRGDTVAQIHEVEHLILVARL